MQTNLVEEMYFCLQPCQWWVLSSSSLYLGNSLQIYLECAVCFFYYDEVVILSWPDISWSLIVPCTFLSQTNISSLFISRNSFLWGRRGRAWKTGVGFRMDIPFLLQLEFYDFWEIGVQGSLLRQVWFWLNFTTVVSLVDKEKNLESWMILFDILN